MRRSPTIVQSHRARTLLSILLLVSSLYSQCIVVHGLISEKIVAATRTTAPSSPSSLFYSSASSRSFAPRKTTSRLLATLEDTRQQRSSHSDDNPNNNNNNNNNNQNRRRGRKNPAMSDTAFLRKRTSHLLRVTEPDYNKDDQLISLSRNMKVDLKTFHFLLDAWAFSGESDAVDQARSLLARMEQLASSTSKTTNKQNDGSSSSGSNSNTQQTHPTIHNIRPDVRSYTKVINAISRSGHATAGLEAEEVLHKMEMLHGTGSNIAARPNTYTYTAAVEAHLHADQGPASAQAAEKLVLQMLQKYKSGDETVCPTARAFQAAMSAHAKSGIPGSAAMAENLFDIMEEFYEEHKHTLDEKQLQVVKPNAYHLNTLITAWANCGEERSAQRAEEVLERMEYLYAHGNADAKPTTVSFNAVIDAFAKSGEEDAAYHAEQVLGHMEELYQTKENVDAKPNVRSFNSVLNAWAKSRQHPDAPTKAQDMLDRMEGSYKDGNRHMRPDVHSFCTVINAWARSETSNKAERALNLYKEMKSLYESGNHDHLKPTVVAVNAVMNACAYTPTTNVCDSNRAVEITHLLFKKELQENPKTNPNNLRPDQVTYGTFLKVLANQMTDCSSRQQIVEYLFKKCCSDGQVGNLFLQQLQRVVASEDDFYNLVQVMPDHDGMVRMEDLPSEWTCNVVEGRWKRRQQRNNNNNNNNWSPQSNAE